MSFKILKKDDDGTVSASYLWFKIVNCCICVAYMMLTWNVSHQATPNLEGFAWLTLVIAGIITGNKFANKLLEYKYNKNVTETVNSTKSVTTTDTQSGKKVESVD